MEACPRDVGGEDALAFTWPTRARRTRHLSGDPEIAKRTALALDCQTVHDKISGGRSSPSARQGQDLESTNAPSLLRKKLPRCSSRQLRCLRRRWIMRRVRARRRKWIPPARPQRGSISKTSGPLRRRAGSFPEPRSPQTGQGPFCCPTFLPHGGQRPGRLAETSKTETGDCGWRILGAAAGALDQKADTLAAKKGAAAAGEALGRPPTPPPLRRPHTDHRP